MACQLVALDKDNGMSPVGVGEILYHLIIKMMLRKEEGAGKDSLREHPSMPWPGGRHRRGGAYGVQVKRRKGGNGYTCNREREADATKARASPT
eukprot:1687228-Ditylum_brightwellii.AAC.1